MTKKLVGIIVILLLMLGSYLFFGIVLNYNSKSIDMKGIDVSIVTEGDGLYADPVEPERYVYKGADPNNYITFNNEKWRILALEEDGTVKIMRNIPIGKKAFDSAKTRLDGYCAQYKAPIYGCNVWAKTKYFVSANEAYKGKVTKDSEIKTYLNKTYYNSISANKSAIEKHTYYYGSPTYESDDLAAMVSEEKKASANSNIGLIVASDYVKSNTNTDLCGTFKLIKDNYEICKNTSWMVKPDLYFTLSPTSGDPIHIVTIYADGDLSRINAAHPYAAVIPALYLKSDIELKGKGTASNPYKITNYAE